MGDPVAGLRTALGAATTALRGSSGETDASPNPRLERPKRSDQAITRPTRRCCSHRCSGRPRVRSPARLGDEVAAQLGDSLSRYEVAGPGFLNLVLSDDWHRGALRQALDAGEEFGAGGAAHPERILLEFVSANPTAVLVAASGRHAAYGDSLARILQHHGHTVYREYYFNTPARRSTVSVNLSSRALGTGSPQRRRLSGSVSQGSASQIEGAADESVDVDVIAGPHSSCYSPTSRRR